MRTFLAVLAIIFGTASAHARTIIVRSTGPSAASYPSGRTLPEPINITLRRGDTLTLLDGRGTTVLKGPATIRGRASVPLSVQDYAFLKTLAQRPPKRPHVAGVSFKLNRPPIDAALGGLAGGLLSNPGARAARARPPVAAPDLWDIDPGSGEDWCINGETIALHRLDATEALTVSLTGSAAMPPQLWPRGSRSLTFPANEVASGGSVLLSWTRALNDPAANIAMHQRCASSGECGPGGRYQVNLHRVDDTPDSVTKFALALNEAGCTVQLARLETLYRVAIP